MATDMRAEVRRHYARRQNRTGRRGRPLLRTDCCGGGKAIAQSERVGYDGEPAGLHSRGGGPGLGCGNPTALGELRAG